MTNTIKNTRCDIRRWWFRNDHDMFRAWIGIQRVDRHQGRDPAHLGFQIAPTRADRVRNPAAVVGDQARHFLDAGARRADDANIAARHDVGETQRRAIEDGGAAIGPHHQQPLLVCQNLQRHLVGDGHVVRKHHHVQAAAQRLARFGGGECAWHGNQCKIGQRIGRDGGSDRPRRPNSSFAAGSLRSIQRGARRGQCRVGRRLIARGNRNNQIARRRWAVRIRQHTRIRHDADVRRRAHHHAALDHAGPGGDSARHAHQRHRVEI